MRSVFFRRGRFRGIDGRSQSVHRLLRRPFFIGFDVFPVRADRRAFFRVLRRVYGGFESRLIHGDFRLRAVLYFRIESRHGGVQSRPCRGQRVFIRSRVRIHSFGRFDRRIESVEAGFRRPLLRDVYLRAIHADRDVLFRGLRRVDSRFQGARIRQRHRNLLRLGIERNRAARISRRRHRRFHDVRLSPEDVGLRFLVIDKISVRIRNDHRVLDNAAVIVKHLDHRRIGMGRGHGNALRGRIERYARRAHTVIFHFKLDKLSFRRILTDSRNGIYALGIRHRKALGRLRRRRRIIYLKVIFRTRDCHGPFPFSLAVGVGKRHLRRIQPYGRELCRNACGGNRRFRGSISEKRTVLTPFVS